MKKVISALTAVAMTASMSASVLSVFAAYSTSSDVSFYLKVDSTGNYTVSDDGKTITFASAADAAGAKFTVGHYILGSVEECSIQQVGGLVEASSASIQLPVEGTNFDAEGEEKTYTLADGTTFTTNKFVDTFAWVNARRGTYNNSTLNVNYGGSSEWDESWNYSGNPLFMWTWSYDFTNANYDDGETTAHYLDATSDAYPLLEFEVSLADDIADGTYTIDWKDSFEHKQYGTTVQSFFDPNGKGKITVDSKEGLTIVVGDPNATTEPESDTSEPDTSEPDTSEPATSEPTTEPVEPTPGGETTVPEKNHDQGFEWSVENVVYEDYEDPKSWVEVPVKVYNDAGISGYTVTFLIDGKAIADSDFEVDAIDEGGAYGEFKDNYTYNKKEFNAIFSSKPIDDNNSDLILESGTTVLTLVLVPRADVTFTPGTKYEISFDDANTKFGNNKDEVVHPTLTSGYIIIPGGEDTTEPDTSEPDTSEPDTSEPDTSEPDTSEPDTSEPDTSEPDTSEPAPVGDYLYGDVNKNGKVELVDIVMLNRYLTGYDSQALDDYQVVVANCYRTGESDADTAAAGTGTDRNTYLDGKDSVEILKSLIGLVATLPTQA